MRRAVRVGLVVLGAAMAVYGAASLTGRWLGTPPWWPQVSDPSPWFRRNPSLMGEGREWMGLSAVLVGLALVVAAWPRGLRGAHPRLAASTLRAMGLLVGSALAVYAAASLTGAWLGEPPWWRTQTAPAELQEFWARQDLWMRRPKLDPYVVREWNRAIEEERARLRRNRPGDPVFRVDGTAYVRPGREWISSGVAAVGLALVTVGAWPRRRAGATS